jgi:hypothetical protein
MEGKRYILEDSTLQNGTLLSAMSQLVLLVQFIALNKQVQFKLEIPALLYESLYLHLTLGFVSTYKIRSLTKTREKVSIEWKGCKRD